MLGRALRAIRTHKGVRVEDLAPRAGLGDNTLWRVERGEGDLYVQTFLLWCAALGVAPQRVIDLAIAMPQDDPS